MFFLFYNHRTKDHGYLFVYIHLICDVYVELDIFLEKSDWYKNKTSLWIKYMNCIYLRIWTNVHTSVHWLWSFHRDKCLCCTSMSIDTFHHALLLFRGAQLFDHTHTHTTKLNCWKSKRLIQLYVFDRIDFTMPTVKSTHMIQRNGLKLKKTSPTLEEWVGLCGHLSPHVQNKIQKKTKNNI